MSNQILDQYAFVPANVIGPGTVAARAIPFVSYMFLHADTTHIAFNCLWLLAFGTVVARRFGTVLFLVFFTVCGVAAAATFLFSNWGSAEGAIGASGAISGLMAAGIRMLRGSGPSASLVPIFSPQVLMFSAVWVGINLLVGLTGLGMAGEVHPIAWQAHLGGYFTGLFLSGVFDRFAPKSDMNEPADA
jgi:membrane associated rhomboid family serine protease